MAAGFKIFPFQNLNSVLADGSDSSAEMLAGSLLYEQVPNHFQTVCCFFFVIGKKNVEYRLYVAVP